MTNERSSLHHLSLSPEPLAEAEGRGSGVRGGAPTSKARRSKISPQPFFAIPAAESSMTSSN